MPVIHRTGDLFSQNDAYALGHGVNCKGSMGAGIAVEFRNRYPEMFKQYRRLCLDGDLNVGDVFVWQDDESGMWVYNMATQNKMGRDARLDAVEETFKKVLAHMEQNDVGRLALPQIGCGIGGLDWDEVSTLIERLSVDTTQEIVLVTYGN